MLKRLSIIVLLLIINNFAIAQGAPKFGHIDTEYILGQMPQYDEKKAELEALAGSYDKEVRSLYGEVEKMKAALKAEEVLLTAAMKLDRQKEIELKEQEALKKYTELFGYDGLYYKKVDEILKPLRDRISQIVEAVAKRYGLDYVFDKAADVGIIYSNPVHDYTEFVLEELGIKEQGN
jgi:outer membrane protein